MYYLSGITCPLVVSFFSLKEFTYHNFNKGNNFKLNQHISGEKLLFLIILVLLPLSFLSANYLYINIELILKLIFNSSYLQQISFAQNFYFTLFFSILFIYSKTRIFVKKITLLNFYPGPLISVHGLAGKTPTRHL